MFLRDKRGIEAMVSYVLLVVIAISLSVAVYGFLKFYAPKDQIKCESEVQLSIDKITCKDNLLEITLTNRGLFTADRFQLRIGQEDRISKNVLNQGYLFEGENAAEGLAPGASWTKQYVYTNYTGIETREVEVQAAQIIDKQIILCEQVVSKLVQCS